MPSQQPNQYSRNIQSFVPEPQKPASTTYNVTYRDPTRFNLSTQN